MIEIAGRSSGPGKPLQYATSGKFMDYFGLRSIDDLPQLKEFQVPGEAIGEPSSLEEVVSFELPESDHDHTLSYPTDESE